MNNSLLEAAYLAICAIYFIIGVCAWLEILRQIKSSRERSAYLQQLAKEQAHVSQQRY